MNVLIIGDSEEHATLVGAELRRAGFEPVCRRVANLKELARVQAERKRLEEELLDIVEMERRRIGLDLHDDLGQKLSGIALMAKGLEVRLARARSPDARAAGRIHELVRDAMSHTKGLARDLANVDVARKDLAPALRELAKHARKLCEVACVFSSKGRVPALDPGVASQVYKIAQEAVSNAIKHGKARRIRIELARRPRELALTVRNDGTPFPDLHAHSTTGTGLRIMQHRARMIGATFDIKSRGSRGTVLRCGLPLSPG